MRQFIRNDDKKRLTEERDISRVVEFLQARGMDGERIAVELTRIFYVDMDALNAVLTRRFGGAEAAAA